MLLSTNIEEAGYSKESIVLEDIQFSIGPGELVGLIGPNGAGKSSTIIAERVRYIRLIFTFSTEVEKPLARLRKKPILFHHSQRIFSVRNKENGLLELFLKAFLRNKLYMSSYFQLFGITAVAIMIAPFWYKFLVLICYVIFINYWLKHIYTRLLDSPFFSIVPYDPRYITIVAKRFKKWTSIPSFIFIGVLTLLSIF